ncbi:hypothetical protein LJC27_08230 [Christensenellaceae bacterium OttesenSCG-928-M15]|nr:hypothetical protein [Christensenellaceae bacterium OttesenSCG-928-M15]
MKRIRYILSLVLVLVVLTGSFAYAANEGVENGRTEEEAREIMLAQAPYMDALEELHKTGEKDGYPKHYAGCYFEEKEFTVLVTSSAEEAKAEMYAIFGKDIHFKEVKYSYNDLLAKKAAVVKKLPKSLAPAAQIDEINNIVLVTLEKKQQHKTLAVKAMARNDEAIVVEYVSSYIAPPKV